MPRKPREGRQRINHFFFFSFLYRASKTRIGKKYFFRVKKAKLQRMESS